MMGEMLALAAVAKVRTLPPTSTRSTRIRVTFTDGTVRDMRIAEAREWLFACQVLETERG